jgi:hypothetical protein
MRTGDRGRDDPRGCGQAHRVNETDRPVSFELVRLDEDVPTGDGAFDLTEREVGPGASGTIVENFSSGDTYEVVCAHPIPGYLTPKRPFAVVGPIVVP